MEIKNKQGGLWGKENLAPQSFAISDLQIALQCHLICASAQFLPGDTSGLFLYSQIPFLGY